MYVEEKVKGLIVANRKKLMPYYAPVSKDCFTVVRTSVCLHKLNMKTKHFPITPKLIHLQGSYLV